MKTIRAIIFDLDGVLAFTDRFHYQAWKEICDERGWDFDSELNHRCRGVSRMGSLQIILDHNQQQLSDEEKHSLADQKNRQYRELLENLTDDDLYPGVIDFLQCLKERNVLMGVGSASQNAVWILKKLQIHSYFDVVISGADVTRSKPDPEVFQKAASTMGIHPFNCLVFEDAASGVEAALAAGMKCVGVGKPEDLAQAPATILDYQEVDLNHLLECGLPQQPPCDPWTVSETFPLGNRQGYHESIFCLANGRLGLRGTHDGTHSSWGKWSKPGFFMNGLFEKEPLGPEWSRWDGKQRSSSIMLNLCDWRVVDTVIGQEILDFGVSSISGYLRSMDMRKGTVDTHFIWEPQTAAAVQVRSSRLVSMTRLDTAAQWMEWKPEEAVELEVRLEIIHRTITRQFGYDGSDVSVKEHEGNILWFQGKTRLTGQEYSIGLKHQFSKQPLSSHVERDDDKTVLNCRFSLEAGECLQLEKIMVARCYLDSQDFHLEACQSLNEVARLGFSQLAGEEAGFWREFWKENDVLIDGQERDQQALRLNIYHLRRNQPVCPQRSISATGVTGANYMGWVFWDTEIFMLPFFNFSDRELARCLLEFRIHGLQAALDRAEEHGAPGALFPWSTIDGQETNFDTFVALAQFHINPDIVYALRQYADTHNDWEFLEKRAAPLIFQTARAMASLGRFLEARGGQFCIHAVCGPDEYNFPVNNNAYTNEMTRFQMETAADLYDRMKIQSPQTLKSIKGELKLTEEEVDLWRRIAEKMFVPFDNQRGIHAQDDQYLNKYPDDLSHLPRNYEFKRDMDTLRLLRLQVTKQADVVLLMALLKNRYSRETRRANFEFYEPRTRHASSLSPAVHSLVGVDVGRDQLAYDYFREAVSMDLDDRKHNTSEGLHFACMGSSWMAAVQGFGGVYQQEGELHIDPRLPKAWNRMAFRVTFSGNRLSINVNHQTVEIRLLKGPGCGFSVKGEKSELSPEQNYIEFSLH